MSRHSHPDRFHPKSRKTIIYQAHNDISLKEAGNGGNPVATFPKKNQGIPQL